MKNIKKILSIMIIALLVVTAVPIQAEAAVKISATKKTLYVGQSTTLKVTGTKKKVKWSSTNKKVATVTQKGKVKAKQAGITTIKAVVAKKVLKCNVKVEEKEQNPLPETPSPSNTSKPEETPSQSQTPSPTPEITPTPEPTPTLIPTPEPTPEPGSKEKPLSGYEEFESEVYRYEKNMGKFKIRLIDYKEGEEAYNLVKNNTFNEKPRETQEYIYFKFELSHLSGDVLAEAVDIINWPICLYRKGSDEPIKIEGFGVLFEDVQSFSSTKLDAGESAICSMAFLVRKREEPVIYNILTGYDEKTYKYQYKWFTTER